MPDASVFIHSASNNGVWFSFFAPRLDSVATFDPSFGQHKDFAFELLNAQIDLINALDCPEDGRTISLRFICHPDPSFFKGRIDVAVLVNVHDIEKIRSEKKARAIFRDIFQAITAISDNYEFEPVAGEEDFLNISQPFEIKSVAEIVRREDIIEASTAKRIRGYSGGAAFQSEIKELIYYVYPFIWGINSFSKLLN